MGTPFRNILLRPNGAIVHLTLNRPDKLNPLDWETVRELRAAISEIDEDPNIVAVIMTGEGGSFSAGGDLEGYISLYQQADKFAEFLEDFLKLLTGMEASEKIFIAAVNGVCVAGGLELLLACDLAIAADTAKIGDGHLNFGQLPGAGGSQRLPRAIGSTRAKHLILTGQLLDGVEAEKIGLVNRVVPAGDLNTAALDLAESLCEKSGAGVRGAKHLLRIAATRDLADGLAYELKFVHRHATKEPDATEGLIAFKEKRKPQFSS